MKKFKVNKTEEYFAYRILKNDKIYKKNISEKNKFEKLLKLLKPLNSEFFNDLKIWLVLLVKWEFDYLNRFLLNPNLLNVSLDNYIRLSKILINLSRNNWISNININRRKIDEWARTNKSFNFMWPRNTKGKIYNISKNIITPRVKQYVEMLPKNFLYNSTILDSGCGPGRYIKAMLKYNPSMIYGMDQGRDIINANKKKFSKNKKTKFVVGDVSRLNFKNNSFDLVVSSGVLHHSKNKIPASIKEHSRVLKKNGFMFVFIVGSSGMQLRMWEFCRNLLEDVDIKYVYNHLKNKISPLRLQGFLDHSYGEYQETTRLDFEKMLKKNFSKIYRVAGIPGADCTPEVYKNDKYFKSRFGDGDLRYLCRK